MSRARNKKRAERRDRYKALLVTYRLLDGHTDYIPAYSHNWHERFRHMIQSLESGDRYYTISKQEYYHGNSSSRTGRWASNSPGLQNLPR